MSQIPARISQFISEKPIVAAGVGLVGVVIAVALVVMATGGGGSDRPPATVRGGGLDLPPTSAAPTATVQPTAVPAPPNRKDCAAIKGTPYQSDDEKSWYETNCPAPGPVVAVGSQTPMGDKLMIPKAGVNAEVYSAAVPANGAMPDPVGYFNAVWYDFSRVPGTGGYTDGGNMVLSGHVDCGKCYNGGSGTAVFWSVRDLKPGDTAQYRTADGKTINYVVTSSQQISPTADWGVIVGSKTADMTLITCTGTFTGGEYTLRHVVAFKKVV